MKIYRGEIGRQFLYFIYISAVGLINNKLTKLKSSGWCFIISHFGPQESRMGHICFR